MKKITISLLILSLIAIDIVLYNVNKILHETCDCRTVYKYIDKNGNSGTSSACYEQDNELICRDIKNVIKVSKIEKERVCK